MQQVTSATKELRERVEARRKKLEARLEEAKANTRGAMSEEAKRIEQRLTELREAVSSGWDQLSEKAAARINEWLRKEENRSGDQHP